MILEKSLTHERPARHGLLVVDRVLWAGAHEVVVPEVAAAAVAVDLGAHVKHN